MTALACSRHNRVPGTKLALKTRSKRPKFGARHPIQRAWHQVWRRNLLAISKWVICCIWKINRIGVPANSPETEV
jgi:hypothetical protein